jgi:hypothetical protein
MDNMSRSSLATTLLLITAAACSSYDFAAVRHPDGSYDLQQLASDLEASGKEQLSEGVWIPLIYLDVTTFKRSDPLMPEGYTLSELTGYGPIFFAGDGEETVFDGRLEKVESTQGNWIVWGIGFRDREQDIETPSGTRVEETRRALLLLGYDTLSYRRDPR